MELKSRPTAEQLLSHAFVLDVASYSEMASIARQAKELKEKVRTRVCVAVGVAPLLCSSPTHDRTRRSTWMPSIDVMV